VAVSRDISAQQQATQRLHEHERRLRQLANELVLAEERERRRLAQALHDGLGQELTLLKLRLQSLETRHLALIDGTSPSLPTSPSPLTFSAAPCSSTSTSTAAEPAAEPAAGTPGSPPATAEPAAGTPGSPPAAAETAAEAAAPSPDAGPQALANDLSRASLSQRRTLRRHFREAIGQLEEIIEESRRITAQLFVPGLTGLPLASVLESLAHRILDPASIRFRVRSDSSEPRLPENTLLLLVQAVRELLHNVVKHADASWVSLRATFHGDELRLCIRDDGQGFDIDRLEPRSRGTGGLGLFSMAERFALAGAGFEIESSPGAGTRVWLTLSAARLEDPAGEP
jgi:signal transduction histidine kinase